MFFSNISSNSKFNEDIQFSLQQHIFFHLHAARCCPPSDPELKLNAAYKISVYVSEELRHESKN